MSDIDCQTLGQLVGRGTEIDDLLDSTGCSPFTGLTEATVKRKLRRLKVVVQELHTVLNGGE